MTLTLGGRMLTMSAGTHSSWNRGFCSSCCHWIHELPLVLDWHKRKSSGDK